jgi:hypothetical protein
MKLPRELQHYLEPLESFQKLILRFNHRGVIIGGIATSVLGEARYTEDLDAMFLLSIQDIPRFLEEAKQEGIEPRIENAADFARKNRILLLRHTISNTSIDISLGVLPFEEEVVERSSIQEFDDSLQVRLPTPEDLIIMKAVAHRPKDFAEILQMPELWGQIEKILKHQE